jgi:hypothetical protein
MTPERPTADPTGPAALDRRGFLTVGGLSIGLIALSAACVTEPEQQQVTQTGTRVPAPGTSVPPFAGSGELDTRLVLTALAVERLAVEAYDLVLGENWLTTESTVAITRAVHERHRQRVDALAGEAESLGTDAAAGTVDESLREDLLDSRVSAVREAADERTRQTQAVGLLLSFEDALSQLYAKATGTVTTATLRAAMGSAGVATARQYSALAGPAGQSLVPLAFQPSASPSVPEDSYVSVD